jgi:hypothetical protein
MATILSAEEFVQNRGPANEAQSSGVSWGAVMGGAFASAALYLLLLALGAGFGLSAVSPWSNAGASASTVTEIAIAWLIFTEVVASVAGGYLAGRLRTKWTLIHTDEVYFRDTANGFLAWAFALVISIAFLASAAASMAGHAAPSDAVRRNSGAAAAGSEADSYFADSYFVDMLFRSDHPTQGGDPAVRAEVGRIWSNGLTKGEMPTADQSYLAGLVAARTGITEPEAQKRVSDVISDARQAEETARKATARLLLWLFVALLAGAFSASYAATVGGRQRDHMKAV